jgi:predicted enzyme related to lactoylglutathione lyase
MHGHFHWNELMTRDAEGAEAFFRDLMGWEVETMPMPEGVYRVMKVDGRPVGGIMAMPSTMPSGTPSHWGSYLEVENVDQAAKRTSELGGTVHRPPWDIPGVGRVAIIADPSGAVLGLITPEPRG